MSRVKNNLVDYKYYKFVLNRGKRLFSGVDVSFKNMDLFTLSIFLL